jgi:hypothetical protein
MIAVKEGQCGLCAHFGENVTGQVKLIEIRLKHEAPQTLVEPCGLPQNAQLNLQVSPTSGCAGFEAAVVTTGD